jgi:hypothetical protein
MVAFLAYSFFSVAFAADPVADRVLSLPGWGDPFPSARYSGYLSGSSPSRRLAYFFVTSETSTPEDDPVILWLNGGPGCSSYIGLNLEQGPLTMNADGSLSVNPGRWNTRANVLFIEVLIRRRGKAAIHRQRHHHGGRHAGRPGGLFRLLPRLCKAHHAALAVRLPAQALLPRSRSAWKRLWRSCA